MSDDRQAIEHAARQACAAGHHDEATSMLIKAYGPEVLGFLVARLRDADDGSEVFSMFCEDLWRGLTDFDWRCSARVWSYVLARNAANRYAKRADRRPERNVALSRAGVVSHMMEKVRTATLTHLRTETRSRVRQLRDKLDLEEQTILELRIDKELGWLDVARILWDGDDEPDDATLQRESARVRRRFHVVKDKLRRLARAEGLLPSEPS